jgi:TetR/AcrR family transcriptional regulator, mexJK operon transcriptional repressor
MEDRSRTNIVQNKVAEKSPSPSKAGRPKSQQKREDILIAASSLFLELGFTATSMDLVANKAEVSKQTVYSHFKNKDALFIAIIEMKCAEYQFDREHLQDPQLSFTEVLSQIGLKFVRLLHDQDVIAMYRVVIGEVTSNPRVAELFYQAGPQHAIVLVAEYFSNHPELKLDEKIAYRWSVTFFNLLKGDFHMCSLLGMDFALSPVQQEKVVATAVSNLSKLMLS